MKELLNERTTKLFSDLKIEVSEENVRIFIAYFEDSLCEFKELIKKEIDKVM